MITTSDDMGAAPTQAIEVAVSVRSLSKRFRLYQRVRDRFADLFSANPHRAEEIWALRDVSFEISKGECFAIIGANGSGKSTLLKLLTGTLVPTSGEIRKQGRVLALLELGAGMNPELTGRENVIASASLLGFPPDYARSRMADIEAFADVGEFFDRPMRIYSSGMFVRVAFATYIFMEPDIFIVDEALSVGDIFFQQKCYREIERIKAAGTTIIFVSHDTGAVQSLCDRAMLLDSGRQRYIGRPDEVVNRYHTSLGRKLASGRGDDSQCAQKSVEQITDEPKYSGPSRGALVELIQEGNVLPHGPIDSGDGGLRLVAARCVDFEGQGIAAVRIGTRVTFEAIIAAVSDVSDPDIALAIYNRFGEPVFGFGAALSGRPLKSLAADESIVVRFHVDLEVGVGQYTFAFEPRRRGEVAPEKPPAAPIMLGPLFIFWDKPTSPFYGVAGLRVTLAGEQTGG